MAEMLQFVDIRCPYCGEGFGIVVDASAGDQCYIEDCQVCCRPITITVRMDGEDIAAVGATSADDA
jgi:hypothetical protein